MRDHHLELIAALAAGWLDDEREARALIESSPEAATEYETQRAAYQALSSSGPAGMTEQERARVRRQVWTELRAQGPSTSSPWYLRWAPAAAALLLVAGVLGVLAPRAMQGGDSAAFRELSSDLDNVTEAGDGAVAEDEATESTAPAAASTTTAGGGAGEDAALSVDVQAFLTEQAMEVRQGSRQYTTNEAGESSFDDCLDEAGLEDHTALGSVEAPEGSVFIVAVPQDSDLEQAPISFVDRASCSVSHVDS